MHCNPETIILENPKWHTIQLNHLFHYLQNDHQNNHQNMMIYIVSNPRSAAKVSDL